MYFGYNTNGFAHHRLEDALAILAELGYRGVALTLDWHTLNPLEPDWQRRAERLRGRLETLGLRCVVETGARFLLDARRKHQPTLVSPGAEERQRRLDFLCRAVDAAVVLGGSVVSFWSGTPVDQPGDEELWRRLTSGCQHLADYAAQRGVWLAFEPEPGMFIDVMPKFAELCRRVGRPNFGLTLDVGHLHCQGEVPLADHLRAWREILVNVHIEDMRRGQHEHLRFGEGEIDFAPVLRALAEIGYAGGVHVELSRHSHDAVETARRALKFLEAHTPKPA
ncbi:MAG: sugar phosphate isomerase/epimerase [Gemmataceae bacterium]|nr:sugar phosphate isomerase/epimerase [Gemmataceae bacterium]